MALSKIGSAGIEPGTIPAALPMVITPTNTSPANGATDQGATPTLNGSTFYALYGYTHAKSQWQVSTSSGFGTTVVNTGDSDSLTSYTVGAGVLSTSTTYYWRVRYKDSNGDYSDWSTATSFQTAASFAYSVEFLLVAGGGGGGAQVGGGGGAGGRLTNSYSVSNGTTYTITVGAGGANVNGNNQTAGSGNNSSVFGYTATGGGRGGTYNGPASGASGGSGGGASTGGSGGAGTAGQGSNGGGNDGSVGGGGGGGAGGVGTGGSGSVGGAGGVGATSNITGSSVYYAGGGGGAGNSGIAAGGNGGGGAGGSNSPATSGTSGTANTGGGGGGARDYYPSGSGGSGVVILRMLTSNYSGTTTGSPTVTTDGSYTVVKFTASGSYTA